MTTTARFRELHASGCFVMPNPHDIGSCKLLTALGFEALATTSAGFANSLGRLDMNVTRDELVAHVGAICAATTLPVNVDSEACFPDEAGGIARTVELLAEAGAAGCSIEDWNPRANAIEPAPAATEHVAVAAEAARRSDIVLTARCENLLHGVQDVEDTLARLVAYRDAGADVVYAPGLIDLATIRMFATELGVPMNVLLMPPSGPTVSELADAGVRRVSIGSSLTSIAYGALVAAATDLLEHGQFAAETAFLPRKLSAQAFSR
jgi:2-methylisocitrate lyase-like PEP mutase family enzyme